MLSAAGWTGCCLQSPPLPPHPPPSSLLYLLLLLLFRIIPHLRVTWIVRGLSCPLLADPLGEGQRPPRCVQYYQCDVKHRRQMDSLRPELIGFFLLPLTPLWWPERELHPAADGVRGEVAENTNKRGDRLSGLFSICGENLQGAPLRASCSLNHLQSSRLHAFCVHVSQAERS